MCMLGLCLLSGSLDPVGGWYSIGNVMLAIIPSFPCAINVADNVMSVDLVQKHLLHLPCLCSARTVANSAELGGLGLRFYHSTQPPKLGERRAQCVHKVHIRKMQNEL